MIPLKVDTKYTILVGIYHDKQSFIVSCMFLRKILSENKKMGRIKYKIWNIQLKFGHNMYIIPWVLNFFI